MDSKYTIRYYVLPDGTYVVRAFTVKNFICYDDKGDVIDEPLTARHQVVVGATQYDVQKNRMNGQIISYRRLDGQPDYCSVENMLEILTRA